MMGVYRKTFFSAGSDNSNLLFKFFLLHPCYKSELLPTCQECFTVPKGGIKVEAFSRRPTEKFIAQNKVEKLAFAKPAIYRILQHIYVHS